MLFKKVRSRKVYNRRASHSFLWPPAFYRFFLPLTKEITDFVITSRQIIENILAGNDSQQRLLVICGPCSIHDYKAAIEYARLIKEWQEKFPQLFLVMRVYLEKPRTSIGWEGFFNDPCLDGSFKTAKGIWHSRKLLLEINKMGVPVATEFLEPGFPTYLAGLVSWAAIGARTTESQTHRKMASGLSMPVGFKNTCPGGVVEAINGIVSAIVPHVFMGYNQLGIVARVASSGNDSAHLILRGGIRPNYYADDIQKAVDLLKDRGLKPRVIVDCSHKNSHKIASNQSVVANHLIQEQILCGRNYVAGIMLESNLVAGKQTNTGDLQTLVYGQSITDECVGVEETNTILNDLNNAVNERRLLLAA